MEVVIMEVVIMEVVIMEVVIMEVVIMEPVIMEPVSTLAYKLVIIVGTHRLHKYCTNTINIIILYDILEDLCDFVCMMTPYLGRLFIVPIQLVSLLQ